MSKFFAQAGSDTETESDESDNQQVIVQKPVVTAKTFQLSDDEEDVKRHVRSAKDKREEEITNIAKQMKNHKKIKDMCKVLSDFEDLTKAYAKAKGVLDDSKGCPPDVFIKCIFELENFINESWEDKEFKKSMSKNNSRGLSSLRQKLKKYNKDLEQFIQSYRDKVVGMDIQSKGDLIKIVSSNEEEEDEMDEDVKEFDKMDEDNLKKGPKARKVKAYDEDEESEEWPSTESEESSSDDEKYAGNLAAKFLKKQPDKEKDRKKERIQKLVKKKVEFAATLDDEDDEDAKGEGDGQGKWKSVAVKGGTSRLPFKDTKVVQLFDANEEITRAAFLKKFSEILAARGKRGIDRNEPLVQLQALRDLAKSQPVEIVDAALHVKILFNIISSYFDYNQKMSNCMKPGPWAKCLVDLGTLIKTLHDNPNIHIGTYIHDENEELKPDINGNINIRICVLSLLEIADEEFTKMLQNCDAYSTEYIDRLKDERTICNLINELQTYLEKRGDKNEICRIYYKRVEHLYYKNDPLIRQIFKLKRAKRLSLFTEEISDAFFTNEGTESEPKPPPEDPSTTTEVCSISTTEEPSPSLAFEKYCKYIYSHDEIGRMRTRAILCHIYYCALHDDWFKARDLLLMSHLQDTVQHSDLSTQTLYNRAMVQLGLCAFRHGLLKEAHDALLDIQSSGRTKELLGQGLIGANPMTRGMDPLTPDQERAEMLRQIPFHAHINLDIVEFVYLFCAMCIETPYIAQGEIDKRKMASKNFYYQLKQSERQLLIGPPDNIRDHVMAAHKAMKTGDWKTCQDFIINDKTKSKVWDLFPDSLKICELITNKIKSECLRVYLFSYGNFYDSIDLKKLSEMFDLGMPTVTNILSKMIINEEIMATFDEPSQTLIMHRADLNRIQAIALQLTEKVVQFSDLNDKLAEIKWNSLGASVPFSTNVVGGGGGYPSQKTYHDYYAYSNNLHFKK